MNEISFSELHDDDCLDLIQLIKSPPQLREPSQQKEARSLKMETRVHQGLLRHEEARLPAGGHQHSLDRPRRGPQSWKPPI